MRQEQARELRLEALGSPRIFVGATEINPSAELVFAVALFTLIERSSAVSRSKLQSLLWPGLPETISAHRLRQTLFKLRRLGYPIEPDGRSRLVLNPVTVTSDYELLASSEIREGSNPQMARSLFEGYEPHFSWQYSDWLDQKKKTVAASLEVRLLERISKLRLAGDWPSIDREARSLLAISPHNEEGILALAESLAMRGDKIESVRVLDAYLAEVGGERSEIKISATIMKKRIADRMRPGDHAVLKEAPLLGREHFMERLAEALRSATHGHAEVMGLWGEAGIGKSRLLTEFLAFASLQGASCLRVTCRSTDANRSLAVLLELIPLLRGMRGAIGSAPETLEFFAGLTTRRPEGRSSSKRNHPDFFSAGLQAAFADIIEAVTEDAPLIICVEDCQWLDTASAAVFASLTQRLRDQRLFLVFTSRTGFEGKLVAHPFDGQCIELPPLDQLASEELIHSVIREQGRQVNSNYLRWCTTAAEGNPFFLREFANHWLETADEHRSPPSLTAVLKQRLARLSSNAIQLLQTCAVLENHASLDNIEAVLGYPAHELLSCINELSTAGMLAVSPVDGTASGGARINSRHDLLSDVALAQLSGPGLVFLHRRAAKVLEGLIEQNNDASTLWSCAKHWQLAGDASQAFRLATSCASHLLEAGLPTDAAEAFGRAQQYASTDEDLLIVLEGRANAFYRGSDWQNVTQTIADTLTLRRKLHPELGEHDELELMQLRADWQTLNWNGILSHSLTCLAALNASRTHRVEAGVMALMMLSFSNDHARATSTFQTITNLSSHSDVKVGSVLQAKMVYHTHWGSFDEAVQAAYALIAYDKESGDVGRIFRSLCNAAVTLRAAGRFEDAASRLKEALSLAQRHHLYLSKARATPMLANLALELGRNDEAKFWLEELISSPIAPDDTLAHDEVSAISARIALLEGKYDDAKAWVTRDLEHMRYDQVPQRRAYRAALTVAVELATTGMASSESLRELQTEHVLTRKNIFQAFASYALYVGLRSVGQGEAAEVVLREYLQCHRREPWAAPSHLLEMMMRWLGESGEARRYCDGRNPERSRKRSAR
jgi:DNA-binding SARP family transcriptional activator/tetratricopeptide (TPR) repeat protein